MATRDEEAVRRQRLSRGRKGGRKSLWEQANPEPVESRQQRLSKGRKGGRPKPNEPREETSFDRQFLSLRCLNCDQIWNGPHTGEIMKIDSPEYHRLQEENRQLGGGIMGGVSDATCNKRSCVDKVGENHYARLREKYPERDFTQNEKDFREEQYQIRRDKLDRFPGGLIEDTPPAPPIGEAGGSDE